MFKQKNKFSVKVVVCALLASMISPAFGQLEELLIGAAFHLGKKGIQFAYNKVKAEQAKASADVPKELQNKVFRGVVLENEIQKGWFVNTKITHYHGLTLQFRGSVVDTLVRPLFNGHAYSYWRLDKISEKNEIVKDDSSKRGRLSAVKEGNDLLIFFGAPGTEDDETLESSDIIMCVKVPATAITNLGKNASYTNLLLARDSRGKNEISLETMQPFCFSTRSQSNSKPSLFQLSNDKKANFMIFRKSSESSQLTSKDVQNIKSKLVESVAEFNKGGSVSNALKGVVNYGRSWVGLQPIK